MYHLKTIPFQNVANLVQACRAWAGPSTSQSALMIEEDPQYLKIVQEITSLEAGDGSARPSPFRGHEEVRNFDYRLSLSRRCPPALWPVHRSPSLTGRCTPASDRWLLPYRKIILFTWAMPRKEPLADILDRAEVDPIIRLIRISGSLQAGRAPERKGPGDHLPSSYVPRLRYLYKLFSNETLMYGEQHPGIHGLRQGILLLTKPGWRRGCTWTTRVNG